jgi:hypothetical protein
MDKSRLQRTELAIYAIIGVVGVLLVVLAWLGSAYSTLSALLVGVAGNLFVVSGTVIFIRYVLHWRPEAESQERQESLLSNVKDTLESILASYTFGVQFLDNFESVNSELARVVRRAEDTIFALGARSRSPEYLKAIEEAVTNRRVTYHRLLNAHHIAHELHEHLELLFDSPNVRISWVPKEKFNNLTVTESECVLVFPAPSSEQLSGLKLPSQANSQRYRRYFFEASEAGITITTRAGIKALCEKCSPETAKRPHEIRRVLLEEFVNSNDVDESE